jgi:4-amino-4-deoxy-L-arabinose transferase-like glycosyltransferase
MDALARLESGAARLGAAPMRLHLLMIVLFALLLVLPGLSSLPMTDRDEGRFVQASRQMVQSGDPVDIRFLDQPRYKKPVGIYWLQSLSALASGQGADAPLWVWRMPSVLGAVLACLLVAVVAAPLIGAEAAFWAALVFASGLVLQAEARIAKTDAVLLASILAGQAVLVRLHLGRAATMAGFWAALALSVMIKGPIGPMVLGLTMGAVSLWRRDLSWLRPLWRWQGILLFLVLVLPWFIAIVLRSGGGFWQASVGEDLLRKVASGSEGKGAPPGSYFLLLWLTCWPASVLLVLGQWRVWKGFGFLLCWVLPAWLVFEAVPTKLVHYTLPLMPALAMLAVAGSMAGRGTLSRPRLVAGAVAFGLGLVPALGVIGFGVATMGPLSLPVLVLILCLGLVLVLGVLALIAARQGLRRAMLVLLIAAGGVGQGGVMLTLPRLPALWPTEEAMAAAWPTLRRRGCAAPQIIGWGYSEPSLAWHGGRETRFVQQPPVGLGACALVVHDGSEAVPAGLRAVARVEGFALGAGRWVTLDVLMTGDAP